PPAGAVRIEEMVNYFPYDYAAPGDGEAPFRAAVTLFPTPWNKDTRLLRIGIQGELPEIDARPPLNLVFLIDTSGSMQDANKLPLLKQSLARSEEHTSELQSRENLVCRLLLEKTNLG